MRHFTRVTPILLQLLFLPLTALGDEPPSNQDPKWFACEKPEDCMLIAEHCGRRTAINKKFSSDFSAWRKDMKENAECVDEKVGESIATPKSELEVDCRQGQCAVREEGTARNEAKGR